MSEFRPRDIREAQTGNTIEIGSLAAWRWRAQAYLNVTSEYAGSVSTPRATYFFNRLYNAPHIDNITNLPTESVVGYRPSGFMTSVQLYPSIGPGYNNAVWIHDLKAFGLNLNASLREHSDIKQMIRLAIEATASGRLWTVTLDQPAGIEVQPVDK